MDGAVGQEPHSISYTNLPSPKGEGKILSFVSVPSERGGCASSQKWLRLLIVSDAARCRLIRRLNYAISSLASGRSIEWRRSTHCR